MHLLLKNIVSINFVTRPLIGRGKFSYPPTVDKMPKEPPSNKARRRAVSP